MLGIERKKRKDVSVYVERDSPGVHTDRYVENETLKKSALAELSDS